MARYLIVLALLAVTPAGVAHAQWSVELEAGMAFATRNDVRIPNETGTLFSLVDDLASDPALAARARLTWESKGRHTVSALFAPLTFDATGQLAGPVAFAGVTFPGGVPAQGTYKFNSYRITYRYTLVRSSAVRFGVGFTGKIRDARIALATADTSAAKTDLGFVPLANLDFAWRVGGRLSLLANADGAWAPQGRAEDVLVAVEYHASDDLALRAGYRMLEGGADVDAVYTFAFLHYLVLGASYRFGR